MTGSKKLGLSVVLALSIVLMAVSGAWAAENTPSDVPTSHWAYQAVKQLLDKGYLELYQDQTFQGDQPVDRYTLATVVAKVLKEIGSGSVTTNHEDVKLLRSLTNEFREELVKVLTDNSSLSRMLEELTRQDQVFKEDLTRTNAAVQNTSTEQTELQKEVQQMIADSIILKKKVEQMGVEVANLKEQNDNLKEQMGVEVANLKKQNDNLKEQMGMEVANLKEQNKKQNLYILLAFIVGLAGAAN